MPETSDGRQTPFQRTERGICITATDLLAALADTLLAQGALVLGADASALLDLVRERIDGEIELELPAIPFARDEIRLWWEDGTPVAAYYEDGRQIGMQVRGSGAGRSIQQDAVRHIVGRGGHR